MTLVTSEQLRLGEVLARTDLSVMEEVSSVAVPIRDYTRSVVSSVAVARPTYRIGPERITAEIAPSLDAAANSRIASAITNKPPRATTNRFTRPTQT